MNNLENPTTLQAKQKMRGYFRARNSFEKCFLKEKTESVLYRRRKLFPRIAPQ